MRLDRKSAGACAVCVVGQRTVGVEVCQDAASDFPGPLRGQLPGQFGEFLLGTGLVFGGNRGGDLVDHGDDLIDVIDRQITIGNGGCGGRQCRVELVAGVVVHRADRQRGGDAALANTEAQAQDCGEVLARRLDASFAVGPAGGDLRVQAGADAVGPAIGTLEHLGHVQDVIIGHRGQRHR